MRSSPSVLAVLAFVCVADWTRRCVQFTAETPTVDVACRMGFYGSTVRGRLWCDDLTLERVGLGSAFAH